MATKNRLKSAAQVYAPQSRDDVAGDIRKLGDLQREKSRLQADMNDAIAEITARYQPQIDDAQGRIDTLQQGVQTWCEANRDTLTDGGKVKTANLVTGEVQWRNPPPSVRVRGADSVIDTLERMGLAKFVRVKKEINKEAILNEPDEVRGIAGINVVNGDEVFIICPFEQEAS